MRGRGLRTGQDEDKEDDAVSLHSDDGDAAAEKTYEESVWIEHNKSMPIDMTYRERERITGDKDNGWLNDVILDNAMSLINSEFPHLKGLQSVHRANVLKFKRCDSASSVLQIMNTELTGTGEHWVLVSTVNCKPGYVNIYDSCNSCYINDQMKKAIANLLKMKGDIIVVEYMYSDQQTNSSDCGVFALANMVALANGQDPSKMMYESSERMRECLIESFDLQNMRMFPHTVNDDQDQKLSEDTIEVYCSCKMPDDNRLYFECEACENWYHPNCEGYGGLSKTDVEKKVLYCKGCKNNNFVACKKKGRHSLLSPPKQNSPKKSQKDKKKRKGRR